MFLRHAFFPFLEVLAFPIPPEISPPPAARDAEPPPQPPAALPHGLRRCLGLASPAALDVRRDRASPTIEFLC